MTGIETETSMHVPITAICVTEVKEDKRGKYQILSLCNKRDEETEIRMAVDPEHLPHIAVLGDSVNRVDLNP